MKRFGILTTNRADYYLLSPIIRSLKLNKHYHTELIVTGGHLLSSFGMTINDITFPIDHVIQIDDYNKTNGLSSINILLNSIMTSSNTFFSNHHFDYVIVLGDRFELVGIALILFNLNIPILHLYGGEVTLGSKDNTYRYLISKLSQYHFVSNVKYKFNLLNNGINSANIYEIGYLSSDLINSVTFIDRNNLFNYLGLTNYPHPTYALISLHPPTNEDITVSQQLVILDEMITKYNDILFIATSSNNDFGGVLINEWYSNYLNIKSNLAYIPNLGFNNYINLIRSSSFVIGNSSSLVTEVPILNIPSILLGRRQEGREILGTIYMSDYSINSLISLIDRVLLEPNIPNKFNQPFSSVDKFETIISELSLK